MHISLLLSLTLLTGCTALPPGTVKVTSIVKRCPVVPEITILRKGGEFDSGEAVYNIPLPCLGYANGVRMSPSQEELDKYHLPIYPAIITLNESGRFISVRVE